MRDLGYRLIATIMAILALAALNTFFGFEHAALSGLGIVIGVLLVPLQD